MNSRSTPPATEPTPATTTPRVHATATSQGELRATLTAWSMATLLTVVFWDALWTGGGIVGGDLYSYFFPQKVLLSEALAHGAFPLWNPLVGWGYPSLAESQTGGLYPPHLLLYALYPAQTAYHVNQLLHYVATFMALWLFARKIGLTAAAATFSAVVYTYAWFPSRLCLEWAILGGPVLPLMLWCAEHWLADRRDRWLVAVALGLGTFLLAGHFTLAFISVLTSVGYVGLRLTLFPVSPSTGTATATLLATPATAAPARLRLSFAWIAALGVGFLLAAVQLLPTWELKQLSQRANEESPVFTATYGHLPPTYLSQLVAPFYWYARDPGPDAMLGQAQAGAIAAGTNMVEAHFYVGLLPLALALMGIIATARSPRRWHTADGALLLLGLLATWFATGWLLVDWQFAGVTIPTLRHVPGFAFFRGPGRYTIVPTLALALLAGRGIDALWRRSPTVPQLAPPSSRGWVLYSAALLLTIMDLWIVSGIVTYSTVVLDSPLTHLRESPVKRLLAAERQPVRVVAPGPNLVSILGVNSVPSYLGLGPWQYEDPALQLPPIPPPPDVSTPWSEWLAPHRAAGVTHVLSLEPLPPHDGSLQLIWQGLDSVLNHAWARPREPIYVYRLRDAPGRVRLEPPTAGRVEQIHIQTDRVTVDVDVTSAAQVILTDIAFPGWQATLDGAPVETMTVEPMFRGTNVPAGRHQLVWNYRPASVRWGAAISVSTLALLAVCSLLSPILRRRTRGRSQPVI